MTATELDARLSELNRLPRVLDAGGWFKPLPQATHVADLLPYETRHGRLNLVPLPGERFTAATWTQADFSAAGFRLPYPDRFFDFAHCGHTIEDLLDPRPLLRELARVARAGLVRCPSRLSEQTRGVRDRMTRAPGHPHHRWIVDLAGGRLRLSPKEPAMAHPTSRVCLPLEYYERCVTLQELAAETVCFWENDLPWFTIDAEESRRLAEAFVRAQAVPRLAVWRDAVRRALRWQRQRWRRRPVENPAAWWHDMLAISRPHSRIPL